MDGGNYITQQVHVITCSSTDAIAPATAFTNCNNFKFYEASLFRCQKHGLEFHTATVRCNAIGVSR